MDLESGHHPQSLEIATLDLRKLAERHGHGFLLEQLHPRGWAKMLVKFGQHVKTYLARSFCSCVWATRDIVLKQCLVGRKRRIFLNVTKLSAYSSTRFRYLPAVGLMSCSRRYRLQKRSLFTFPMLGRGIAKNSSKNRLAHVGIRPIHLVDA